MRVGDKFTLTQNGLDITANTTASKEYEVCEVERNGTIVFYNDGQTPQYLTSEEHYTPVVRFKRGDKVRSESGEIGEVYAIKGYQSGPYCVAVNFPSEQGCLFNQEGERYMNQNPRNSITLVTEPTAVPDAEPETTESEEVRYLPEKFKLNPGTNAALSKAIQLRLFDLGFKWGSNGKNFFHTQWISGGLLGPDHRYLFTDEDADDATLLTIADLFELEPRPAPAPSFQLGGETLTYENGRVKGRDLDVPLMTFLVVTGINADTGNETLGGFPIERATYSWRGHTVTREDFKRAKEWAGGLEVPTQLAAVPF